MIENIKRLGTELEAGPLSDRKLFEQTHVPVLETRIVDDVADAVLVVESSLRRRREDGRAVGVRG